MTTPPPHPRSPRHWLLLADLLALAAALALLAALTRVAGLPASREAMLLLLAFSMLLVAQMAVHGGYRERLRFQPIADAGRVLHCAVTAGAISLLVGIAAGVPVPATERDVRVYLAVGILVPALLMIALRVFGRRLQRRAFVDGAHADAILLVGTDAAVTRSETVIRERPELGIDVAGTIRVGDDERAEQPEEVRRFADALAATLAGRRIDQMLLAFDRELPRVRAVAIREAACRGLQLRVAADSFEHCYGSTWPTGSVPVALLQDRFGHGVALACKHASDRVLASLALVVLAPLLALVAFAVRLEDGGPAFFLQRRVGERGREFYIFKFRTMSADAEQRLAELRCRNEAEGPLFKMRSDPRVTRVGRWLRRTSLDELPQLLNVVAGHMSLVGPRPPIPEEVDAYDPRHRRRLMARPGITGLWQVSGRSDTSFEQMVSLDVDYIEHWSLALDASLLLRTIPAVLRREGAY